MIELLKTLVEQGYAATLENAEIILNDDNIYSDFFTDDGSIIVGFDYIDSAIYDHRHELKRLNEVTDDETV